MTDAPRTQKPADPLFIDEVHGHQARYKKIVALTHSATKAAGIMLLAAIAALVLANTVAHQVLLEFSHLEVGTSSTTSSWRCSSCSSASRSSTR